MSRFVARPIVVVGYNKVSEEGARCYNEEKREMNSLFKNFIGDKTLIKIQRAEDRLQSLKDQIKRFWSINNYRTAMSYTDMAKKGPINQAPKVYYSLPSNNKPPMSVSEARRDFTLAFKRMQTERANARKIVEGMAARRPVYVSARFAEKQSVEFKTDKALLNKERKALKQPREVKSFPIGCYADKLIVALPEREIVPEVKGVARPTSPKQVKKRWNKCSKEQDRGDLPYPTIVRSTKAERKNALISALSKTDAGKHLMMGYMRVMFNRAGKDICDAIPLLESMAQLPEPQMDSVGAEGKSEFVEDKASTTLITHDEPVDVGKPHEISDGFHAMSITKEIQHFNTVTDRWIPLKTFTWKTTDAVDKLLFTYDFPYDFIKAFPDSQNMQLLYTHRWFRPKKIRVKFVMNSNKFQVGLSIADVLYLGRNTDVSPRLHNNVYSALQRNHAKLMAGSSNDAELNVPFEWVNSSMTLLDKVNHCRVSVRVLNQLTVATGVATACNITAYATFEDIELNGMIARTVPEAQMDSVANVMNAGANLISTIRGDPNRDNPPLPLNPVSLIPQAMGSLAHTDFVAEPVFTLRADPRGQTPHNFRREEMSLEFLRDSWSFLKTVSWSTTQMDSSSRELFSIPIAPLLPLSEYPKATMGYVPTTLAMLASFFGVWRGDIELMFELVMNSFYSGRFKVAAIPLLKENESWSYEKACYSTYVDFDTVETGQRVFSVPWNWYNAFAKIRDHESVYDIPAVLKGYWVNPLIAISNVPPTIYINIYIRGAPNFEVALPKPSILAPRYSDAIIPPSGQQLKPYNTESAMYLTYKSGLQSESGTYPLVPYIQNVTNGWVGYTNLRLGNLYKLGDKTLKGLEFRLQYKVVDKEKPTRSIRWGTYMPTLSTANAHGLVVSWDRTEIEGLIAALKRGESEAQALNQVTKAKWNPTFGDGPWSQVKIDNKWVLASDVNDPPIWTWMETDMLRYEYEIIEPQMNTQSVPVTIVSRPSMSTGFGAACFGESAPDLKSLCRRWNHYGTIKGETCIQGLPRDCPYTARLRVSAMRHVDPTMSSSYDNRYRNGVVTTIGSMYYLSRGGLRLRFVTIGNPPEGTMMYVSHRYDQYLPSDLPVQDGSGIVLTKDDMMNTQYATHGQALSVNSVFTIEVPYYQVTERQFVSPHEHKPESDNGSLYVWIHSKVKANIHVEVFYSIADDFRFSTFQGVPICIDTTTLQPEPQMDEKPSTSIAEHKATESKPTFLEKLNPLRRVDVATEAIVSLAEDAKKTNNNLNDLIEKIKGYVENTVAKLQNFLSDPLKRFKERMTEKVFGTIFDLFAGVGDKLFRVISQIIYIVLNPTWQTISWSLVNLYHLFFNFTLAGFQIVSDFVRDMWHKVTKNPAKPSQEVRIEPQLDDSTIGSYASLLYGMLASACSLKVSPPTSWEGIEKGLFKVGLSTRNAKSVGAFVEDNVIFLRRIFQKLLASFGFGSPDFKLISGIGDKRLSDWVMKASLLVSAQSGDKIMTDKNWSQEVFEASIVGRSLYTSIVSTKGTPPRLVTYVADLLKKIVEKENDLIKSKIFSGNRYEPFCAWICGEAGTGKSRLIPMLAARFAASHGDVHSAGYAYSITAGQKYFDGFKGQQVVVMDDFLPTSVSDSGEILHQFLQFKSDIPLNLPMSQVADKANMVSFKDLIISSNRQWIGNEPGIVHPPAYNRRRDLLLDLRYRDPSMTSQSFKGRPAEEYDDMRHVTMWYSSDPSQLGSAWIEIKREEGVSYGETVMKFIMDIHKKYHDREALNFSDRVKKIRSIINAANPQESFESCLKNYVQLLEKSASGPSSAFNDLFSKWFSDSVKMASHKSDHEVVETEEEHPEVILEPMIEPQMDERPSTSRTYWPYKRLNILEDTRQLVEVGEVVDPVGKGGGKTCRHKIFDMKTAMYDSDSRVFLADPGIIPDPKVCYAVSAGPCLLKTEKGYTPLPSCIWHDPSQRKAFLIKFRKESDTSEEIDRFMNLNQEDTLDSFKSESFPEGLDQILYEERLVADSRMSCRRAQTGSFLRLQLLQKQMKKDFEMIDQTPVPRESRWKSIPKAIWQGVLTAFNWLSKLMGWLHTILIYLFSIFAMASFAWMMKATYDDVRYYQSEREVQGNLHPSGDYKTIKRSTSGVKSRAMKFLNEDGQDLEDGDLRDPVESCKSSQPQNGVLNKILRNFIFLVGIKEVGDTQITYKARCFGLYNHTALVLKHYVDHWRNMGCTKVAVISRGGKSVITYGITEMKYRFTAGGYGLVNLPKSYPHQFANIIKFIPSEDFVGSYPAECQIIEPWLDDVNKYSVRIKRLDQPLLVPQKATQSAWTIEQGLSYPWAGKGRCGSIVFAPGMACPLIGVHTAGIGETTGFAEILLRETFEDEMEYPVLEFVEPNMHQEPQPYGLDGEYYCVGRLDKDKVPQQSTKTKIIPSLIHGIFPVKTEPAPLSGDDPRLSEPLDIFRIGVSKRCEPLKEFDARDVRVVSEYYRDHMTFEVKPQRAEVGVLSYTEAIEGFGVKGYDPIIMSTSEGYPWTLDRPKGEGSKAWMFRREEYPDGRMKITGMYGPLKIALDGKTQLRKAGIVPATYFTCCLKDARILKEKVSTPGKTRVFEMCPVDLTISQRQYYQDYVAGFLNARGNMFHTIGINPDGPEWTQLASELQRFSPYILTADYSGYGPHVPHSLLYEVFQHRITWFNEHENVEEQEAIDRRMIRECIREENMHGLHVVRDAVVRFASGLDSGNPSTVDLNSEVNSHLVMLGFLGLAKRKGFHHYADLYYFQKFVLMRHNGDDLIMAVKPEIIEWFNNETLISFFAEYGLKMTDALKEGKVRPYCSLEEATYLKRGFLPHPTRVGQWLAPLEEASITDTANWIWKSLNDTEASLVNSEMSSRLAYTRGPEFYNSVSRKIFEAWKEKGIRFEYPTWESLDAHIWDGKPGPKYSF